MSALRTSMIRALRISDPTPDAALVQAAAHGDDDAFRTLITRHGPMVLRVCRHVLNDDHAAEDAFQAVFLVFARRDRRIARPERLAAWLFGTARHVALRAKRSASTRRRHESQSRPARSSDPSADLTARELFQALDEEVERLPETYRLPLLLCYWQNLTQEQTARRLGWSAGSVKGRLERGRKMLAARLTKRGLAPTVLLAVAGATVGIPADLLAKTAALTAAGAVIPASVLALASASGGVAKGATATLAAVLLASAGVIGLTGGGEPVGHVSSYASAEQPALAEKPIDAVEVAGRVLTPDGHPAVEAKIFALKLLPGKNPYPSYENVDAVFRASSGKNGSFAFTIPREKLLVEHNRSWPVMAASTGWGLGWTRPALPTDPLTIRLVKDQPIAGRVVDSDGQPVPKAVIRIHGLYTGKDDNLDAFLVAWKQDWRASWDRLPKRTVPPATVVTVTPTYENGRFTITGAGVDLVVVFEVTAPGAAISSGYIINRDGLDAKPLNALTQIPLPNQKMPEPLTPIVYGPHDEIVIESGKKMSGTIRDFAGKPIAGARVSTLANWGCHVSAVSDVTGQFTLRGLRKQPSYVLNVRLGDDPADPSRLVPVGDSIGFEPVIAQITFKRE